MPNCVRDYLCVWREPAISRLANVAGFALTFAPIGGQGHCLALDIHGASAEKWPEVSMQTSRKELRGSRAYTLPLFGIFVLLASYWLLADWEEVPAIIRSALDAVHWLR